MESYLEDDKLKHVVLGLLIYSSATHVIGPYMALALTVLIAAGKELVWDMLLSKGTPELDDFFATVILPVFLFLYQIILLNI